MTTWGTSCSRRRSFFSGHPLYDQTYTRYGPAYYAWQQFLHAVIRLPLSHDSALVFTSFAWVTISLLCAGFVARLARNVLFVAITLFTVFGTLEVLRYEPGHPQEYCALLLGGTLLCASLLTSGWRPPALLGLMGFFIGLLGMTKPNLGVFAALAGAIGLLPLAPPGKSRAVLFWLSAAAAILLPIVLMHRHLASFGGYCLLMSAATFFVVIHLASLKPERPFPWRWFGTALAGLVAGGVAGIFYALATGSSFAGIAWGLFFQHISFDQAFWIYPPFEPIDALFSVGLAAGLWVIARSDGGLGPGAPWGPDAIRVGAAACIVLAALVLDRSSAFLWCLPMAVVTSGLTLRQSRSAFELAPRSLALCFAVLLGLWGYPIWAPAQQGLSFFLLIPVAVVSCADAVRHGRWSARRADARPSRPAAPPGLAALTPEPAGARPQKTAWTVLSCAGATAVIGLALLQANRAMAAYTRLEPSGLPGSRLLRMPREQINFYDRLIQAAHAHGRSFFTMPGLGSLYFWANQNPPTCIYPTSWMTLLTPDQQSKVVDDLQKAPDLCVIRWNYMVGFWTHGQDISQNRIVRYLEDNFIVVESFDGCDILVRRRGSSRTGAGPGGA